MNLPTQRSTSQIKLAMLVAALGYFVDVYDLVLFSVLRQPSLLDLGVNGSELLNCGVFLLNTQMAGMLLGGIIWGIWGDKRGRISVLFGSILLYSLANIANGFVESIEAYAAWRFLAGLGLAGELGAGITLISEIMSQASRGWGTTIVASVGVAGALAASAVGDDFHWRTAYFIGGAMGLALLVLRISVHESGMFKQLSSSRVTRGSLVLLFSSWRRIVRYLSCIAIGLPTWFAVGIVMTFSPELGPALGMIEIPTAGNSIFYGYAGIVLGDLVSGALSQLLRSRRGAIFYFLILCSAATLAFPYFHGMSLSTFYWLCFALGFGGGFWAVFVTTAAEQFGTNLRATVATSVPNFVRGAVVPMTLFFRETIHYTGIVNSMLLSGAITLGIAALALYFLEESYHRDLNFVEQ